MTTRALHGATAETMEDGGGGKKEGCRRQSSTMTESVVEHAGARCTRAGVLGWPVNEATHQSPIIWPALGSGLRAQGCFWAAGVMDLRETGAVARFATRHECEVRGYLKRSCATVSMCYHPARKLSSSCHRYGRFGHPSNVHSVNRNLRTRGDGPVFRHMAWVAGPAVQTGKRGVRGVTFLFSQPCGHLTSESVLHGIGMKSAPPWQSAYISFYCDWAG